MKKLWITLLALWISALPLEVFSAEPLGPTKCGTYEILGVIRYGGANPVLKVYENSISETIFQLEGDLKEEALFYIDKPVTVKGALSKPVKEYRGALSGKEIKERVPDPLHPMKDSEMKLLKEVPCSKKD